MRSSTTSLARRWCAGLAAALTLACATNPVTGRRELSFMSEAQEIQIGQEMDVQIRQEMGLYDDPALQRYVQDIGLRIAKSSQRPNLPWRFAVVDFPAVNAFALPGGYIYLTRGILPFLDNEAQLVGVLGHEIGHVTARHSAQQYTRGLGATLGVLVGSIFVPEIAPFGDLAQGGLGVLFLKFGRDDELQADALGAEYAAAGGWDPSQIPAFLTTLARITEVSDRDGVPNWLQTHPQPADRVTEVAEAVQKAAAGGGEFTLDREGYLARIDGMVFGDSPEDGIVRGSQFLHAPLRFAVAFPEGWEITNSEEQVVAQEPGNKVFLILRTVEAARSASLEQVALRHMQQAGYRPTEGAATTINGLEAFVATYQGNASGLGKVMARGAHIVMGRNTYFIGGIAVPDLFPQVLDKFNGTIRSFREMSRQEAENIRPNLIDLYTARAGDTWQSIAAGPGKGMVTPATLAIMNDHALDEQPRPGERLKIVVAG